MRSLGILLASLGLILSGLVGADAQATTMTQGPVTCPPGARPDPYSGRCIIVVPVDPVPPVAPRPVPDPGDGDDGGGSGPQVCTWRGSQTFEVPCTSAFGFYSNERQCYIEALSPQPPVSDPVWQGRTDGAIYRCTPPYWFDIGVVLAYNFWSESQPPGVAAPPDPRVLARQAIATMDLSAITIGMVPESEDGSVGLVGMPAWMWVEHPTDNTWGPITRSASAAGYTVTATAQAREVRWDMGDGTVLTCGVGTPYEDRFGKQSSPTCGHTYPSQGEYTVAATSHWVINWSGIGQSGVITMDLTRTVRVTIGEVQVLRQR